MIVLHNVLIKKENVIIKLSKIELEKIISDNYSKYI